MRTVRMPLLLVATAALTVAGSALPAVADEPGGATAVPTSAGVPASPAPVSPAAAGPATASPAPAATSVPSADPTTAAPGATTAPTGTSTPTGTASAAPSAGATAPAPADAPLDLTVVLQPSDRSGLHALAQRVAAMTRAQRRDALARVAPTTTARSGVVAALRAAGLRVTGETTWDVEVTGTVAQAESVFGVRLTGRGDAMHPTAEPHLPASLAGAVTTVLGLDQRPLFHANAIRGGRTPADLAAAYGVTRTGSTGAGTTIATVQFSGWSSNDLTTYANAIGVTKPKITQLSVDGASTTTPSADGGDGEVAVDQEMLLATAPAAAQRIYFAPNDAQGIYDAYDHVATDVGTNSITALSTSWGMCETSLSSSLESTLQDAIDRIVVAGATTFAASGDTGAYDCSPKNPTLLDVDFPAVLPSVVGVGGTTLNGSGTSWSETAWSDPSTNTGTGGGASTRTGRPSYQSSVGISGSTRLVPDISATANPSAGPGAYIGSEGGWLLAGGTSTAAPVAAGQFAATLSSFGCTSGIGDIHAALYANRGDFRDVTSGNNLHYSAGPGYDETTGLGSPNWSALASALPGTSACTRSLTAPTTLATGHSITSADQQYTLTMQTDGNLVLYGNGKALWATGSNGGGSRYLSVQTDGNAVVYTASGTAVWSTGTSGKGSSPTLAVTNTGDVQLTSGGTVIWHSGVSGRDTLTAPVTLTSGQFIQDASGRRELLMQPDGNLVVYIGGAAKWSSSTSRYPGAHVSVQADGNIVVYDAAGVARWASGTNRSGSGTRLVMQSDGNLVLYKGSTAQWSTGTRG